MLITTNQINFFNGLIQIILPAGHIEQANDLGQALNKGKRLVVKIEPEKKKRSLNANACMWAMLNELAIKLHTTAEELYIEELRKYGVRHYIPALPESIPIYEKAFKFVEVVDREPIVTGNRQDAVTLAVYLGSSTYNTAEFSRLLDGIIEDAKEQGCIYISPEDRDLLIERWGKDGGE
ncbi:MAG: recombination protein NinB [Phascolarctobacterium sp.]|nr:recombination protein NinB [Candidatus Phascolarctobacterium caballi]